MGLGLLWLGKGAEAVARDPRSNRAWAFALEDVCRADAEVSRRSVQGSLRHGVHSRIDTGERNQQRTANDFVRVHDSPVTRSRLKSIAPKRRAEEDRASPYRIDLGGICTM
jgi:hypothetical protein